jgi:Tfp pilus assembly protein PilZ
MKSILLVDKRSDLLATLEPILKHWGYRVLSTREVDQVATFLQESAPCLLIISEALFSDPDLTLTPDTEQRIKSGDLPVIALKQDGAGTPPLTPSETLEVPVELFALFSFIQGRVEKHPRQNLRLRLKLPGMYCLKDGSFMLAEVLSLSVNGLFFKTSTSIKKGDRVTVVFPLLGLCKEIEIQATVLYTVLPETENKFSQGFGAIFDDLSEEHEVQLQQFIRQHFLNEVSASQDGVGSFVESQLKD